MREITNRMVRANVLLVGLVVLFSPAMAPAQEASRGEPNPPRVTASTSWTAAFAEAAGADVGRTLAPIELRHPPEYDFRPGDIRYAVEADFVIWAGYEMFMRGLFQAAEIDEGRVVLVQTNNTPPVLKESIRALAERFGTEDHFAKWALELDALAGELIDGARRANAAGTRVVVNAHFAGLAEWLGYEIVDQLGMGELTPGRLREILAKEPDLIIDNWHNPTGEPLRTEVPEYITWINFPGRDGTRTLLDVLRQNAQLAGLLEPE
jgi:zinc transport system substrate-binding protein